jgi:hypothetical protein
MTTQFIVNEKGERTSVIIPIDEFEDLLNAAQVHMEPGPKYKAMMDQMLKEEEDGTATYVSLEEIEKILPRK